jgi:hypothetical protein
MKKMGGSHIFFGDTPPIKRGENPFLKEFSILTKNQSKILGDKRREQNEGTTERGNDKTRERYNLGPIQKKHGYYFSYVRELDIFTIYLEHQTHNTNEMKHEISII